MFNLFKIKQVLFFSLVLVFVFSLPVSAETTDWKNPSYHFEQVKTILVKTPVFSYNYIDGEPNGGNPYENITISVGHKEHGSDKKHFEKYPNSQKVIMSILTKQIEKLPKYNFIYESAGNTATTEKPAGETIKPAAAQESDVILSIKITDFGWYCKHYKDRWEIKEGIDIDNYTGLKRSAREPEKAWSTDNTSSATLTYTRHFSNYEVREFAIAEFILKDAKTGEEIWKYTDSRYHESNEKAMQKNWPEATMNHIFTAAFGKMPFVGNYTP